ncbi:hypothetical protein B0A48_15815 [Cryoendolithus antarcticus]|uniref:BZIP domain-containing protein n=1 Tax=Cryoendolithus antarcticus TaxID=1507870 RepID=A0A1V8SHI9_9PEZI|nr:hypothetical protein B0A48_15815 [Cryoendolithus antarcticus]
MAAAVTSRLSDNSSLPGDKSSTSSPRTTRGTVNTADDLQDAAVPAIKQETQVPTINQPEDTDTKDTAPTINAPLAPPPKPSQSNGEPDYFSQNHSQFSREPNPFENAFGNPAETPGPKLPGVNSLTSPASLLPAVTPGWPGSLRSGPLSPAMLTGPTSNNDYFSGEHNFNGSFPTPNESSLRSGLTPGGGGSMFPQPSPNSQAIYSQLQSGGATPGTLDFHRTAIAARAHSQNNQFAMPPNVTSQPQSNPNIQPDLDSKPYNPNQQAQQQDGQDPFAHHESQEAAMGLQFLANGGRPGGQQQFAMPQQAQHNYQGVQQHQDQHKDGRNGKNSINSHISASTENGHGDYSDGSLDQKPQRNGRGKKGSTGKAVGGKRKSDDTPSRIANKRSRNSNGAVMQQSPEPDDEDMLDGESPEMEETGPDGKKMTDEEKRKNFLERNRVAALKCRQRKKQWLANLQQKVEIFSTENDALAATVTQLREEIVGLKTLLLAHKECPVSQAQGLTAQAMQQITGDGGHQYNNPYGMMGQQMQGQGMQMQGQRSH